MTAEVAILNKSAITLAADSAVTISVGSDEQKVFDCEDKLFELTRESPIAAMVSSDLSFMEAPLSVLIKQYRDTAPAFTTVREAADHFLTFLDSFARSSPARIEQSSLARFATDLFESVANRASEYWQRQVFEPNTQNIRQDILDLGDGIGTRFTEIWLESYEVQLDLIDRIISRLPDASFIGGVQPAISAEQRSEIGAIAAEVMTAASNVQRERAVDILSRALWKRTSTGSTTGLVVAGFGSTELFPTLIYFELQGSVGGRLKFGERDFVDIDRDGVRARVLPFAQREMVERFLYGLDGDIERQITEFAKRSVPDISQQILDSLDIEQADRIRLTTEAGAAEKAFFDGLAEQGFQAIRKSSMEEIEEMVEFMPKPEMARMAEALVNLTSIKRRVSRGFETVGGPIDVAVISKSDGLVWVKRKHYFAPELNARYFERIRGVESSGGRDDE